MGYIFVGLGNPDEQYIGTRHNTGRIVLLEMRRRVKFPEWENNKKVNGMVSEGKIGKSKVKFLLPETFMNRSGLAVKKLVTSKKAALKLVVIYDDIDLPLGKFRISFARGSGGHNGIESISKSIGTKNFIRIRVGISPSVRGRKLAKKPKGEKKVLDFLMGKFKKAELDLIEHVSKDIKKAMEEIVASGYTRAMNKFN